MKSRHFIDDNKSAELADQAIEEDREFLLKIGGLGLPRNSK